MQDICGIICFQIFGCLSNLFGVHKFKQPSSNSILCMGQDIAFETRLAVTEITGSETFVHLDHHGTRWVGLIHGVRNLRPGQALTAYLDPAHVYVFAEDGPLVAPAAYVEAA